MATEREREIRRRQHRRKKLLKLRNQLAETKSKADKEKIIAKIRKLSPRAPIDL